MKRILRLAVLALGLEGTMLAAQEPIVLHGTIEKVDGPVFSIKTRYSAPAKFMLGPSPHLIAAEKASFDDIHPGAIVHLVSSQRDGKQAIVELQLVAENAREIMSQMLETNGPFGVVQELSSSNDEYQISLKQGSDEKRTAVSARTPVIVLVNGAAADLKVGAAIVAADGKKVPDGLVQSNLVVYGRAGVVPNL